MIGFHRILLESHEPEVLSNFLSQVFDVEADYLEDGIEITIDHTKFFIMTSDKKRLNKNLSFEFYAVSKLELEEFKQKLEFYFYTHQSAPKNIKMTENGLQFEDTDGRSWRVALQNQPMLRETDRNNVRFC